MRKTNFVSTFGALAVSGMVLLAAPALGQDTGAAPAAPAADSTAAAPAAEPVSESHLSAARRAIEAIGATEEFDTILLTAATQTKAEFIPNNPDLQTEISNMVDDKAIALAPRRAALETEVARVYAGLFSEAELNEIADFYSTEAGKKLLTEGPKAARESLGAANVWTNGILRDLRQASLEGMNEIYQANAPAAEDGAAPAAPAEDTGATPQ
ncbi:DUF2059 domain-containing protein [Fulvimarina sp. 2208YS6-2-32]|uniref:DUF2059 domain-containing protein n=1 Tax=Fulvimarina uroteuthidis TaxID=3098149 RepID=A0ABU5HXF6_9HYPH|nr:DUF2059 domain-containing protein [Fulvimarina sp. 2208YS6-2-32]MDY8107651.1 DUF2059 domain-containing protein [Fulvimarina sp. 2208YS6-2-32]